MLFYTVLISFATSCFDLRGVAARDGTQRAHIYCSICLQSLVTVDDSVVTCGREQRQSKRVASEEELRLLYASGLCCSNVQKILQLRNTRTDEYF